MLCISENPESPSCSSSPCVSLSCVTVQSLPSLSCMNSRANRLSWGRASSPSRPIQSCGSSMATKWWSSLAPRNRCMAPLKAASPSTGTRQNSRSLTSTWRTAASTNMKYSYLENCLDPLMICRSSVRIQGFDVPLVFSVPVRWAAEQIFCLHTENVSKPSITCQNISSSSSSNQSAVLLCSVDPNRPQSPLMFEWSSEGNAHTGEALTIFLGGELDERQYTCQVSNPVSHEAATFTARNCKTGRISPVIWNAGRASNVSFCVKMPLLCLRCLCFCFSRSRFICRNCCSHRHYSDSLFGLSCVAVPTEEKRLVLILNYRCCITKFSVWGSGRMHQTSAHCPFPSGQACFRKEQTGDVENQTSPEGRIFVKLLRLLVSVAGSRL